MSGIKRACSYSAAITTPINPANYSAIVVTFAQDQEIIIEKQKSELELTSSGVVVHLLQSETALFIPSKKSPMGAKTGGKAYMQIRVYASDENAPGSDCWPIEVYDSLSDEVIGNG